MSADRVSRVPLLWPGHYFLLPGVFSAIPVSLGSLDNYGQGLTRNHSSSSRDLCTDKFQNKLIPHEKPQPGDMSTPQASTPARSCPKSAPTNATY